MDDIPDKANISLKYRRVNNVSVLTLKYVAKIAKCVRRSGCRQL
jgi:hypothetical protein